MSWESIPGWSNDIIPFYRQLAERLPKGGMFVEVGVLFGRSLACMGALRPDLELYAVDTWEHGAREGEHAAYQATYGTTWDAFCFGMREHANDVWQRVHVIRARSTSWLPTGRRPDCVFIDADHEYAGVHDDIDHWIICAKMICGHDYQANYPGVVRAVDEAFGGKHMMGPGDWTSVWVAP